MNYCYVLLDTMVEHTNRYGIAAVAVEDDVTVILESCIDLSLNREDAQLFVSLCNEHRLDIVHFWDAIDDFL